MTGTKTDTPLLLTPQSISVVTQDEIFARGATSLQEALFYTPGVTLGRFGSNSVFDYPVVRGFVVPTYVYGLRTLGDTGTGEITPKINPYGAERIEVLRGSSSSLYGQTPPGGLVNVISKRPQMFDQNEVGVRFGNFNHYESFFDINKAVDPGLQVRFVGSGQLSGTQQDFVRDDRYYLAPSITFRPTQDTSFTVLATTQRDGGKGYQQFVPGFGSAFPNPNGRIPYNRYLGEPVTDTRKVEYNAIGYAFEHRFNEIFQFRQNARFANLEFDRSSVGLAGAGGLAPDFRTVNRRLFTGTQSSRQAAVDSQLQADFATGPVIHKVLAGVDYYDTSTRNNLNLGFGVTPIDLFNPRYGVPQNPIVFPGTDNFITLRQTGVYVQDQARWDRLLLTLTGRYDRSATNTDEFTTPVFTRERNDATTGRAALSYLFDGGIAPYISYATNFDPTPGLDRDLNTFKPRTGVTREAGVKFQPFAGALFTAAVFDTDQKNVLTTDLQDPNFQTQIGAVNVKGIELEARVSVNRELDLVAGYSHLIPKVTASNDGTVGNYQPNVASDTASLWAMYTFRSGTFGGLGIGGGVRYIGRSYADDENLFAVPSSTIFDAAIAYDFEYMRRDLKGLSARINVTNIGNTYYVTNCFSSNSCGLGVARTVMGTLSYRWH